ncbi:MAG: glycosyltransferase family 2 protein [Lachnospiraceae bacterium]|nr:glycosyltransferase family 2 protein [Lachnospiraceae bacterium]
MIVCIGVVKNAADMIESMVRGNSVWADQFVFYDNMSTDRTAAILDSLRREGLPIEVLPDTEQSHLQKEKMQKLIRYVVDKYSPGFLIALDDDEILCSNREDLRPEEIGEAIQSLDRDSLYYISWRNYIPTEEDDPQVICVPERFRFCFDDEPEMTKKVLIPAKILTDDFTIADGNHYADGSKIKKRVHLADLRIAHYPVRSPQQIASKAVVGWMNNLTMPEREQGLNYHWERMYRSVRDGGLPSVDLMQAMCTLYRENPNDEEHLNVVCRPIRLPEKCMELKYTSGKEVNLFRNICFEMEALAESCAKYRREMEAEQEKKNL